MARQATDSFVIEIAGAPQFVAKGEVLAEGHPVLKALPPDSHLFRQLEEEPAPEPAKTARKR